MSFPQSPRSVVSAAGTDVASEDGARFDQARFESLPSPNFPQERPGSAAAQRPGSRRGYQNYRNSRAFGGGSTHTSRPVSGAANRLSLTHAPAISPAFLRPMSAQRLQSQRSSARPSRAPSRTETRIVSRAASPPPMPSRKNSLSSYPNTPGLHRDSIASRPETPRSEFSAADQRDMSYYSFNNSNRNYTLGSTADSTRPLARARAPSVEDLSSVYRYSLSKEMRRSVSIAGAHGGMENGGNNYEMSGRGFADGGQAEKQGPIVIGRERNWEHFSGNTVFCWGGRLQNTRDRPVSIVTALLVIIPTVIYCVFEASRMWHELSPALPIIYAYLFYICMSSFVHASVTDPGILPRNLHPFPKADKNEDPLTVGPSMTDWTMVRSFGKAGGAMDVPTKYCKSCNIWRPPRAHHCRVCDSCIETQDHHCVWLNNCVGRRNYRYFFTFISSAGILAIYLCFTSIGLCVRYASDNQISFGQSINENRAAFAMFFYGLIVCIYPLSLMGYHLFLTGRGETTREYLNSHKFKVEDRHRPYDHQSWPRNWVLIFCRFRTPTYLRFKDAYIEGDQRFGPARGHRQAPLSTEQQGGGLEMESMAPAGGNFQGPASRGPILPT